MPLVSFTPPPGIWNDGTFYSSKNQWYQAQWVRFKESYAEKIGGWVQRTDIGQFLGISRLIFEWIDLSNNLQVFIGTSLKAYVATNGNLNDITPIRQTDGPLTNPFTTLNGSHQITVVDSANGAIQNDFVTYSGVTGAFGGISGTALNAQFQITSVIDGNTYTINGPSTASGNATGGGTNVTATYELNTGGSGNVYGNGWGAGAWGRGTWGSGTTNSTAGPQLRLWSGSNFGQDCIINPRGGGIYYWPANSSDPAVDISTLVGAADTPVAANYILVSAANQQVFALGVNEIGSSVIDPLFIRWTDEGSASDWEPLITNASGALRLSLGSQIYSGCVSQGQIIVWTESSTHALIYIGGDLVWGEQVLSPHTDILGPNAFAAVDSFVMWMGKNNFFICQGSSVSTLPCPVRQYVFSNINYQQAFKVFATTNSLFREIWFFYPSAMSQENDSYVVFNYVDNTWYFGSIARTSGWDRGLETYPQWTGTDSYVYYHENGWDDGSQTPAAPITAELQSGPIELQDGDDFVFVNRIIPDITFLQSTNNNPTLIYSISSQDYPGGVTYIGDTDNANVTSLLMEQYTNKLDVRQRGRHFWINIQSSGQTGVAWRLGVQRFDMRPDGKR